MLLLDMCSSTSAQRPNRWCKCISLGKLPTDAYQCTELSNKQDKVQLVLDVLSLYALAEFWPLRDVRGKKGIRSHSSMALCVSTYMWGEAGGDKPDLMSAYIKHTLFHATWKKNKNSPATSKVLKIWSDFFYRDHHLGCRYITSVATRTVIVSFAIRSSFLYMKFLYVQLMQYALAVLYFICKIEGDL